MTLEHRRYLLVETLVSAAINAVLSIVFVLLLFGGMDRIGPRELVLDALPQSFAIALMASLVPRLLTARRLRAGVIAPASTAGTRSRGPLLASLLTAVVVAALAGIVHALLLPRLIGAPVPFAAVLVGKAIYGALLGAGVTWLSVRDALARP